MENSMLSVSRSWIEAVWLAVAVFWFISAISLKPVARRQSTWSRMVEVVPLVLAAFLLFGSKPVSYLLNARVLSHTPAVGWTGFLVTVAGAALAIVARAILGANWSGRVTIKQGHELIRRGPYAVVRHPIYSGLLLSVVGTAIAFGEVRHFLAIPLTFFGWWAKMQEEERLLTQEFGERYAAYQREVKGAIIPHIL